MRGLRRRLTGLLCLLAPGIPTVPQPRRAWYCRVFTGDTERTHCNWLRRVKPQCRNPVEPGTAECIDQWGQTRMALT